jgi:hypothetical protein
MHATQILHYIQRSVLSAVSRNRSTSWNVLPVDMGHYHLTTHTAPLPTNRVIHKSVKNFKNSQQIDYATDHGNSYTDISEFFFFLHILQMLNVSTFGNMADIYVIVHLIPHVCQHLLNAIFAYYCLLAENQGNYVRGLFL